MTYLSGLSFIFLQDSNWSDNLQIVNLHPSMWNMALANYTQELQTYLHDEFFKLSHRPKEPVREVIKRIDNILQQMTEQPSEAQKIAVLKCCLNPCLLESVSNALLLRNAEKYDQAVQIALSIEANLYAHKTPSSISCPLHPTSRHSAAECKQIKQMKDSTQTPSKANTDQRQNGNNYGSSSSSFSSSGHPPSNNKYTCRKCSSPWQPGHQCKPRQPAALNSSQVQTSSSQQPASTPSSPSSPSPSPASPPSGTNQPSINALDVTTKQEFMKAETQGNIELAAIDLNSLLHPGNASDSAMDDPSLAVTHEAIHKEGLDTDDNDDVEDNCKDKVEPPITAPILLNRQYTTAFIDPGASHSFITPAVVEKYLHPASCEHHHMVISYIGDMEITLGDRSTTRITCRAAHICINCGSHKLHHHFFIIPLQGEHEILFRRDIIQHTRITEGIHDVLQRNQQVPHGPSSSLPESVIYLNTGDAKFLGPLIIPHCTNNRAYVLQDITGNILPDMVPPSALKPVDPDTPFEDEHFEVEKVLDHDGPPSDRCYLMKWKGYPDSDNSWVAAKDFGSQRPISTYWGKKYPKKRLFPINKLSKAGVLSLVVIAAEAIVKSTLSYGLCMTELSKSWWKKIEAVWNETARSVLQVHRRTVAGVCRAELGWLTIKAYCELERQAVIHHAERQDGHFELLEEVSQASEEEGEKNEGEGGDGTTVVEKKAKRMRALTRVAKMEYAAEGERGTRAWLWHNFLTNGRCLVGQQRSLVITNPRKERLMNAIRCGGLPIGKKWGSIQQSEVDSKCPACDAEEETAEHFLLRCPNLWEDRFRIWSVDNGSEEQVRKLIIEDCTTKLLSSGKKCNRAQEMEQCKQSCKRVWRLWAARASWKHGSSSAFYQSLEVMDLIVSLDQEINNLMYQRQSPGSQKSYIKVRSAPWRTLTKDTVKPKYGFAIPYSKVGAMEGRSIVMSGKDLKKESSLELSGIVLAEEEYHGAANWSDIVDREEKETQ
ncbi:Chromo domain-containing protein [Balamuthia mandrillaris]